MSVRLKAEQVKSGPIQIALMPLEARVLEVLRRTPVACPPLCAKNRSSCSHRVRSHQPRKCSQNGRGAVIAAGFSIEAMLPADGLTTSSAAGMEAAEKLDQALEVRADARDEPGWRMPPCCLPRASR